MRDSSYSRFAHDNAPVLGAGVTFFHKFKSGFYKKTLPCVAFTTVAADGPKPPNEPLQSTTSAVPPGLMMRRASCAIERLSSDWKRILEIMTASILASAMCEPPTRLRSPQNASILENPCSIAAEA